MSRLQEQLSSGKQLSRPSDSPVGTSSAMQFRAEIRGTEQFVRNADDGINWLGATDDTLTTVVNSAGRARTLMLAGLNGTASATEREALATEIDAIRSGLLDAANATYLDRPLFAGTADVGSAYDRTTGAFIGNIADENAPSATGKVERRIAPGVTARVNLTGPEVFGPQDGSGRDLFAILADAAAHLRAGDNDAVGNDLTAVDLQLQEVSYQAALSATARVIQPSLLDFLR